jgi:hypothetical protein
MLNPLSMELLANDIVQRHLQQAARDELTRQLPRTSTHRPDVAARQHLADGLRVLAARLDPCLSCEPSIVVASPR